MSKRLQVIVSEWARNALRAARRSQPSIEAGRKLEVIRTAAAHDFPTADIDRMLREIEEGHSGKPQ